MEGADGCAKVSLSIFEKTLIQKIEDKLPGAAPGVQLQVYQAGRKVGDISVGETYPYYDLASLTKTIFTVQGMIWAFAQEKWNLKTTVQSILHWFPSEKTLVRDLLTHSSGLDWWQPFFESLKVEDSRVHRWTEVQRKIRGLELKPNDVSVYSDVGFILLGCILESLFDKPLIDVWKLVKEEFYPRSGFDFHVDNKPANKEKFYAPTERCDWRGKLLQGEVHDDNTWALGGVSSHAGLFSSIDDVSWYLLFLRSQLKGISRTKVPQKIMKTFTTRARPAGKGDWALGFMMPTPGASSAGNYFSQYSIGHTGFTGTSFWYDPVQDLGVVLLSNRTLLGRENKEFVKLRPMIHNWVIEGLKRS